ncbi:MAG: carboxypeptidase regulatory-like domain-containing protein [Candidatus Sericytochromatia bacterium]|nr:carboxypeptidase regulatory-like domain-containing protein [Candidatus Sericytochromatia bacterium]
MASPTASANTYLTANPVATATVAVSDHTGVVLREDGKPAAGVVVTGYPALPPAPTAYRLARALLQVASPAPPSVKTDTQGRFKLADPEGKPLNLEAAESDTVKAFQFNVPAAARGLTLQLANTGTIRGLVKGAGGSGLKDAVVTLPGTPYRGVTDDRGEYAIVNVPSGDAYSLAVSKEGVGAYNLPGLTVRPAGTVSVADVLLGGTPPTLTDMEPQLGGRGTTVTLTGTGLPDAGLTVEFGTLTATEVTRQSPTELRVKVPSGADSEDVRVRAGTIVSNSLKFKLLTSLTITPVITTLTVGSTQVYTASALDANGMALATAPVRWEVSDGGALTVDAEAGTVTANLVGTGNLVARSGELTSPPLAIAVVLPGGAGGGGSAPPPSPSPTPRTFTVSTLVGGAEAVVVNGAVAAARFAGPTGVALAPGGASPVLFVVDGAANQLRRVSTTSVTSVAGGPDAGTDDGVGLTARFNAPARIAFERAAPSGDTFLIADALNHRIRRFFSADNRVETIAGGGDGGALGGGFQAGISLEARFNSPGAAVVGPGGAILVADSLNHCIRRIDPTTGVVTVLAGGPGQQGRQDGAGQEARFDTPVDLVVAADGTLYVADAGNRAVREVSPAGVVSTIVARDADRLDANISATFESPAGLALDGSRLYLADSQAHRIRLFDLNATPRTVTTLCGSNAGFQDGVSAQFNQPQSLALDASGDLFVVDAGNRRLRKIDFSN